MKLLIITQKVDSTDPILEFFQAWIREFARQCEQVTVICLQKGPHSLPKEVRVLSLGKESGESRWGYIKNFYRYIIHERKNYDAVYVHMNQLYVLLGWPVWKLFGKTIGLWYMHKSVTGSLRVAEKLTDVIFTGSEKSFRIPSKKVRVVGHGIDTDLFTPAFNPVVHKPFSILTVGRITAVKNIHLLPALAEALTKRGIDITITVAGPTLSVDDAAYLAGIRKEIAKKGMEKKLIFVGPISNNALPEFLKTGDLFINLGDNGSLDKAVLEAMSSGLKVLTSNEAFVGSLPHESITSKRIEEMADKIIALKNHPIDPALRHYVVEHHNLKQLVRRILDIYLQFVRQ